MFNLNNDIVCHIISRAREIEIEGDLYLPGDPASPQTEDEKDVLAEDKDDLTLQELKDVINDLEPDQQKELIALLFIGTGDFEKEQWADALKAAHDVPPQSRADYLISKPMLSEFLTEGLSKFGYSCDE